MVQQALLGQMGQLVLRARQVRLVAPERLAKRVLLVLMGQLVLPDQPERPVLLVRPGRQDRRVK
jgi:hypothetical protein